MTDTSSILRQQQEYYRARAAEYDEWWLRRGRFDRGEECNQLWFAEAAEVRAALAAFRPAGRVLELACGTGIWTEQLARYGDQVTAVDGSAEMLAINAGRLGLSEHVGLTPRRSPIGSAAVRYVQSDLFEWQSTETFDAVFFSFWLSHVPLERFEAFWELVGKCLKEKKEKADRLEAYPTKQDRLEAYPTGRVFFIDSRREPTSTAVDHQLPEASTPVMRRLLNDGREFEIYKIFYDPAELTQRLSELGWRFEIRQTERYFLYGVGERT